MYEVVFHLCIKISLPPSLKQSSFAQQKAWMFKISCETTHKHVQATIQHF